MKRLFITASGMLIMLSLINPARAAGQVGSGTPASCTEAALTAALNNGGLITFACGSAPHTITVTSPKLISSATTLDGGGLITLSGGGKTIVLRNNSPNLTLQNLTIADGYATINSLCGDICGGAGVRSEWKANLTLINTTFTNNVYYAGGAVNNDYGGGAVYTHTGTLIIRNSRFINNRATGGSGGAIHALFTNAEISDTTFENNQAGGYGGAFYNDGLNGANGYLRFSRVHFINNSGRGQGGAMFNWMYVAQPHIKPYQPGGSLLIEDAFFSGNVINPLPQENNGAYGGAWRVGNGPAVVRRATFAGNSAGVQGGAIWTGDQANLTLENITLSGNRAANSANNAGLGGGVMIANGTVVLNGVTLADNHAGHMGGGIWGGSSVTLRNTLISGNTANNPWGQNLNCGSTYSSGGGNLQAPKTHPADRDCVSGIAFADPKLAPLQDNGGFAPTRALLAGSAAIDAGSSTACLPTDQRGAQRFDGDSDGVTVCDSGAYEYTGFGGPSGANAAPYRNATTDPKPTLTWSAVTWAAGYALELAVNPQFSPVLLYHDTLAPNIWHFTPPAPLASGVYYWRVRAKRADGSWSGWSAPETFAVMAP